MTHRRPLGLSYLELMLVVAMMSVLTALVLPTGITMHRRMQEEELRRGLVKIRAAIDAYHRDWEKGCVDAKDERGWPKNLEELHEGVEWADSPQCNPEKLSGKLPEIGSGRDEEPEMKTYLPHVPRDPFNREDDEWDTMGWKARDYEDEPDATSWGGKGLYDVYSSSELVALDGTKHGEW